MRARHSHHEILGVSPSADADDIRAAYRRLLRTCHPDLGGSPALFDLVNEAYTALLGAAGTAPAAPTDEGDSGVGHRAPAALRGRRCPTGSRPTTEAARVASVEHAPADDYVARRRSRSPLWRPQAARAYELEPVPAPQLVSLYL